MSYKVFTNGSPLPASDLNTFLMNQSVITFANATERDATLTAPTEGMCVYLENNNHFQIYSGTDWVTQNPINAQGDIIVGNASGQPSRLAVGTNGSIPRVASGTLGYLAPGTNGQVLSISGGAPTWTTPAGGGDKVFTQLFNGNITTGTQDFVVSGLTSYDTYVVRFNNVSTNSANASFYLYPNSSFSNNFITYLVLSVDGSSRTNTFTEVDTGSLYFGNYTGSSSNSVNGYAIFQGCKGTTPLEVDFVGGTSGSLQTFSRTNVGRGIMVKAASVSSFTLTSSNNFDTGTLQIWGA